MKPFNIEEAKAGKPVCTRDGKKVRIVCFDAKGGYPLIVLLTHSDGCEIALRYPENGILSGDTNIKSKNDLCMAASTKHVGWINIWLTNEGDSYFGELIYDTEEEARNCGEETDCVATAKIEWED